MSPYPCLEFGRCSRVLDFRRCQVRYSDTHRIRNFVHESERLSLCAHIITALPLTNFPRMPVFHPKFPHDYCYCIMISNSTLSYMSTSFMVKLI